MNHKTQISSPLTITKDALAVDTTHHGALTVQRYFREQLCVDSCRSSVFLGSRLRSAFLDNRVVPFAFHSGAAFKTTVRLDLRSCLLFFNGLLHGLSKAARKGG